jgi:hypothetical protein
MTATTRPYESLSHEELVRAQKNNDAAWRAVNDKYNAMSPYDEDRRAVYNHINELSDGGRAIRNEFASRRQERQQRDEKAGIPSDPNRRFQSHSVYELLREREITDDAIKTLTNKLDAMMPSDEDRRAVSKRLNELVDELAEVDGELATR